MLLQTHQHMPNILISPFKTAETDADSKKALATPHVAWSNCGLPELQGLTAVHKHLHRLLHISLQQVFQGVIVLVLRNKHKQLTNKTKKWQIPTK